MSDVNLAVAGLRLDRHITPLVDANSFHAVPGIGPITDRIACELIHDGGPAFVERAVRDAGRQDEIGTLRGLRRHFLSRAAVADIVARRGSPSRATYRGDFQMHSVRDSAGAHHQLLERGEVPEVGEGSLGTLSTGHGGTEASAWRQVARGEVPGVRQ